MKPQKSFKSDIRRLSDLLDGVIRSDKWLGSLWIGLGVATWFNSILTDVLSVIGPILVGLVLILPIKHKNGLYFVMGFAVVADRVISYSTEGLWNPLFVWLMLGSYVYRAMLERDLERDLE